MAKNDVIENFFNRFKDYSKPSKLQVEFLDFYKRKDTLTQLENKKFLTVVRSLENIDKLNYHKKVKRNLEKEERAEKRRELTHLQIIAGAALLKALGSDSKNKQSYETSFNNLISENFIDEDDAKKLKDFLIKNASNKSDDVQESQPDANFVFNKIASGDSVSSYGKESEFNQFSPQQSILPLGNIDTFQ